MAGIVSLDQQKKLVKFKAFEVDNPILFAFFDKEGNKDDDVVFKALYIGVLALLEDRLSAFFARTNDELGTRMESLKLIFEMKKEIFFKTAVKGADAETDIAAFLHKLCERRGFDDAVELTGATTGTIPKNKTGDIVCTLDGRPELKVVIEVKFDKSLNLGDIGDKDLFTKKSDTAWSQLLEAQVNRGTPIAIIVFDEALVDNSIQKAVEGVGFLPGVGFIALVNSQAGDYTNLAVAYTLARDLALHAKDLDVSDALLTALVKRLLLDLKGLMNVDKLVADIVKSANGITAELDKKRLSLEFTYEYLQKFLKDGTLTREDMFAFYGGEAVREKYKVLEVTSLANPTDPKAFTP